MSSAGLWSSWYVDPVTEPIPYGNTKSYGYATSWLKPCATIEDWGCGWGFFRDTSGIPPERILNVDGTRNDYVDRVVDLCHYRPSPGPDGINLRHTIEHNFLWQDILQNACTSAVERIFLSVFTPEPPPPRVLDLQIDWNEELGVPDLAIADAPINAIFEGHGFCYAKARISTETAYGIERLWFAIRR